LRHADEAVDKDVGDESTWDSGETREQQHCHCSPRPIHDGTILFYFRFNYCSLLRDCCLWCRSLALQYQCFIWPASKSMHTALVSILTFFNPINWFGMNVKRNLTIDFVNDKRASPPWPRMRPKIVGWRSVRRRQLIWRSRLRLSSILLFHSGSYM
jgi:hypothetical protein